MKSITGRELARILEKHGWNLCESTAAITFTANREALCDFLSRCTAIKH